MTEILLFHHAHGLTPGVVAFADELRTAGHVVHTPDLFLYPGDRHLFADNSLPDHDEGAARLLTEPVLALLNSVA